MNSPKFPLPLSLNAGGFLVSEMDTLVSTSQAPRLQANSERSSNRIAMQDVAIGVFILCKIESAEHLKYLSEALDNTQKSALHRKLAICPAKSLLRAGQPSHCQLAMDLVVPQKLVATTCVLYETSRILFCMQSHRLLKFTHLGAASKGLAHK
jgi:hypothetical protein